MPSFGRRDGMQDGLSEPDGADANRPSFELCDGMQDGFRDPDGAGFGFDKSMTECCLIHVKVPGQVICVGGSRNSSGSAVTILSLSYSLRLLPSGHYHQSGFFGFDR